MPNTTDKRHKPMNKYLQYYLISYWLSFKYDFVEDLDIDENLRLPENWDNIKKMGLNYV